MVVLVDTNILIDFLLTREPYFKASSELITKCAGGEIEGYIAFHSIPNLWYILRKAPEEKRRDWLTDLCSFLRVGGATHEDVVRAIKMKEFRDFEDCLQDRCAESAGADYIITRNTKDFEGSSVPALTPEEFLNIEYDAIIEK